MVPFNFKEHLTVHPVNGEKKRGITIAKKNSQTKPFILKLTHIA